MKKKIGVILSGCGVYDGSEVHEAVITLLAIERGGAEAVCMAPEMDQMHVINHMTGEEMPGEKRNVRIEAARIARGPVRDIAGVSADEIDALFIPGGFGAAKNLSDFAVNGENCQVNPDVARLIREFREKNKPQGAVCIAPAIVARAFSGGAVHPTLTIGNDKGVGGKIESMGGKHQDCAVQDYVIDEENKIVSAPAYMLGQNIAEVADGIEKAVAQLLKML
ncbi:MAG: isoprenoid biosynthesis glyoxalase ElbB [Candidatus Nitrohelix vancouverensis]|uniref:Isoprenoid biosynthesis glyoxalase ElbB n=1 Tax=Candidatus Nitrohelix vancouverensis TaxID=2705534 RepID=A0A7T0C1N7_9BACT|nr:MAG: isoprenoid biosynthesis glyoxalase ElbB [Candidatus Nitrohelix vancouverensis]